jgi:hypothetical protein
MVRKDASRTGVARRNFTRGRITHPFLRPYRDTAPLPIAACAIDVRCMNRHALIGLRTNRL